MSEIGRIRKEVTAIGTSFNQREMRLQFSRFLNSLGGMKKQSNANKLKKEAKRNTEINLYALAAFQEAEKTIQRRKDGILPFL